MTMAEAGKQMQKSAKLSPRTKQRDYTIPLRLNQSLPPLSGNNSCSVGTGARGNLKSDNSKHTNCMSLTTGQPINNQVNVDNRQSRMTAPISMFKAKRFNNKPTASLMVIAIATLSISTKVCHTQQQQHQNSHNNNNLPALSGQKNARQSQNSASSSSNSHKEHLLSYLSENIERQHFNLKPIRSIVQHPRPSKFDSGEDLSDESSESNSIHKSKAASSSKEKVDQGLRQILRMHESIAQQHAIKPIEQMASSTAAPPEPGGLVASKLRDLTLRGPVHVASSLIAPNKVVSQVLSYISPLISSKLMSHPSLFDLHKAQQNSSSPLSSPMAILNPVSRLAGLHPFVGRSNNQATLVRGLFQKDATPTTSSISSSVTSANQRNPLTAAVTALPQTSYLARPDLAADKSNVDQRQFSTQPTTLLENFGDTVFKSALIKPNISPKDLMTSESASSSFPQTLEAPSNTQTGSLDENHSSSSAKLVLPQRANSWLKNSANAVAQNYLQDSFRGLLTLSQLPILQAGPISTAPSVLEKPAGGKHKDGNRVGGAGGNQHSSQSHRRRAIDELYRYAYILGTGVRRKRDPLSALSSSHNSATALTTKKRGVFSQRSRNQLMMPNQNQLMNYARLLTSLLPPGASGAKPRGVMWDMATDPSLAVTVFHLLERASVALPLGFMLMPLVKMIHNPINGINLGRILPTRASHRSVDYEQLAKRLDVLDKMLGRTQGARQSNPRYHF